MEQRHGKDPGYVSATTSCESNGSPADLSVAAMLVRHGECELTAEEFERRFGHLSGDGEG
ncbi:MAG: hypothetical protein ACTHOE_08900 [Conexibacter sp.]